MTDITCSSCNNTVKKRFTFKCADCDQRICANHDSYYCGGEMGCKKTLCEKCQPEHVYYCLTVIGIFGRHAKTNEAKLSQILSRK